LKILKKLTLFYPEEGGTNLITHIFKKIGGDQITGSGVIFGSVKGTMWFLCNFEYNAYLSPYNF